MTDIKLCALAAAAALLASCGSTSDGSVTRAQAPVQPDSGTFVTAEEEAQSAEGEVWEAPEFVDPWAPKPWTGAFGESAIMLANAFRIEGPEGVLEHVIASSDDEFYERSLETTPEGLLQVIRRVGQDVPEIRVKVDGWSLAAFDRVVILERVDDAPVRIVATGEAIWRDPNGRIAMGERLECVGEIGDDTPAVPPGATSARGPADDRVDAEVAEEIVAEETVEQENAVETDDANASSDTEASAQSAEPVVPAEPDTHVEPESNVEPDASVEPESTVEPDASVEPESTVEPEASFEPEIPAAGTPASTSTTSDQ